MTWQNWLEQTGGGDGERIQHWFDIDPKRDSRDKWNVKLGVGGNISISIVSYDRI